MKYAKLSTIISLAILLAAFAINTLALGQLDSTFGLNGAVYSHINLSDAKIILQSDGKILKYGISTNGEIHIYRYNANGTPDLNFGSSGRAIPYYPLGAVRIVVVQSDGKIVAAGNSTSYIASTVCAWRFNANGTHDTGFGTNGRALVAASSTLLDISVVRPNIFSTGQNLVIVTRPSSGAVVMTRLDTNGAINTSFGSGGVVTLSTPAGIGVKIVTVNGSTFQSDAIYTGMVRAFTSAPYKRVTIAKYSSGGLLDTSFGINGMVNADYNFVNGSTIHSLRRTAAGKFYFGIESAVTGVPGSFADSRMGVHFADGFLEFLSQAGVGDPPTPHTIYGFRSDGSVVGNRFSLISRISADLTTILDDFQPTTYTEDGAVQSDNKLLLIDADDTIRRYQP